MSPKKKKLNYKKEFPELYRPSRKTPRILDIPSMKFFMIDGQGDPNTSEEYAQALKALYKVSYTLKMKIVKKKAPDKDYVVPPLEGLWYMDDMNDWSMENKNEWQWTMMIRIPDYITNEQIDKAFELVKEADEVPAIENVYLKHYDEGKSAQILHVGPYEDEPPTIKKLHSFIEEQGYKLDGDHHEIYLSDPRRSKPQNLKTVIRQPISKQ